MYFFNICLMTCWTLGRGRLAANLMMARKTLWGGCAATNLIMDSSGEAVLVTDLIITETNIWTPRSAQQCGRP